VLLVEDEPAVRALTARVLTAAGYHVVAAGTGTEALEIAAQMETQPDILVTDAMLPGIHGGQVAARLRERWPGLRTLLMSGYMREAIERSEGLDSGLVFLQKPFTPNELLTTVRRVLDGDTDSAQQG
jgi:two-component system, cell cycle sensor histidine kinase and response regulator CckA